MNILTQVECKELLSGLRGGIDRTFESIGLALGLLFQKEIDKFKACVGYALLLDDTDMLDDTQRFFALYAILDNYWSSKREDGTTSKMNQAPEIQPFRIFLLEYGVQESSKLQESELIHLFLIRNRGQELHKKTLKDFLNNLKDMKEETFRNRRKELKKKLEEEKLDRGLGAFARSGLKRYFFEEMPVKNSKEQWRMKQPNVIKVFSETLGIAGFVSRGCDTQVQMLAPPSLKPMHSELQNLNPIPTHNLVYDCSDDNYGMLMENDELCELIQKALEGPLMPNQQKQILQYFTECPKLVFNCSMTPKSLPKLVENSPTVTFELLSRLMSSQIIHEYLYELKNMSMSLHSMEVVNRLASSVILPIDFIHGYISNCIASCNIVEDRYMQSRLVRLVCVFLTSLIKNETIVMQDLVHEVQAFCIDHSRIKEAAILFRVLKNMENENKLEPSNSPIQ